MCFELLCKVIVLAPLAMLTREAARNSRIRFDCQLSCQVILNNRDTKFDDRDLRYIYSMNLRVTEALNFPPFCSHEQPGLAMRS